MSELEKKTLAELKEIGAEMGLKSISGLKKSELIEKIEAKQLSMEQKDAPTETASDFSQEKNGEIPQETTEKEKWIVAISLLLNLSILFFFKYANS